MKTLNLMSLTLLAVIPWSTGCNEKSTTAPSLTPRSGRIEISVTDRGFVPSRIEVTHGVPVTLVVTRRTADGCANEMVMPAHGIRQQLPVGRPVEITCTPDMPGETSFGCGMGMMKGTMVAR